MGEVKSIANISKVFLPVFMRVLYKTAENSEHMGRQARPGIEPSTSRLPAFERRYALPLVEPRLIGNFRPQPVSFPELPSESNTNKLCDNRA